MAVPILPIVNTILRHTMIMATRMTISSTLVSGPIEVVWLSDESVEAIRYNGEPLPKAVSDRLGSIQLSKGRIVLPSELSSIIVDLLDAVALLPTNERRKKIFLADRIFEHLVVRVLGPNPKLEGMIWRSILGIVWQWEDQHEEVHKGTPYYFMGATYLGSGDVPSAYSCFFSALEEDKRNFPHIPKNLKDAPAYLTTSLVDNPGNALYNDVVVPLRATLQSFIDGYNTRTGGNLKIQDLDRKFLQADSFEDIKRFFVANFHEVYHLGALNSTRMIKNDYSRLKVIDSLFNFGLIVDQMLESRFLKGAPKKDMANAVYRFALNLGWTAAGSSKNAGEFISKIRPKPNEGSPDEVLPAFLEGTCTYDGGPVDARMRTIIGAYHLRNYGGHHLDGSDILVNRYADVLEMAMDSFFAAVEAL